MEKRVRIILQTAVILTTLGLSVEAQPVLIKEIPKGSTNFISIGDLVYFVSGDSLLRTDGTSEGTILLKSGYNELRNFTEFNGIVFFADASPEELWRSDGTPGGTILLKSFTESSNLDILDSIGNYLLFRGYDPATGLELYRTDGTPSGTVMVKDINPGPGNGFLGNSALVGDYLFFLGNNGSQGGELWKSDGTAAGTFMVKDINTGVGNGFVSGNFDDDFVHRNPYDHGHVYSYNNQFFFSGYTTGNGQEPWVSDGTAAGTFMLKDTAPGMEDPVWILYGIGHDGSVYFITKPDIDPSTGRATATLWKTGGTTASTVSLSLLIEDGSGQEDDGVTYADPFRIYNGKVYFFGRQYLGGHELWVTDGTPSGTQHVYSVNNFFGDYIMYFFEVVDDYLLFYGTADAYPTSVYRSDGTTAGTDQWIHFNSGGHDLFPRSLTAVGEFLFYGDHDGPRDCCGGAEDPEDYFHLFQADPSALTTHSMRTLYGVSTSGTGFIVDYNGKVIFSTHNDQDESTDRYLWIYDPVNTPEPEPCAGTGTIIREVWNGIPGKEVSLIPVNSPPSSTSELTIFEGPFRVADNYGARIRGYVCVPETGNYTFWISSDDRSELWLSTDDNPANKVKIASVGGATSRRQWDKYTSQKSSLIPLTAGRKYYIEALHKESVTYDHVAVGWQLPDGTMERPIPGNRLIPFQSPPSVNITSPEDGQNFSAPATVNITADASSDEGSVAKVEFYNGTTKLGEDATSPYAYAWNNVSAGDYTVIAKAIDNLGVSASDSVDIAVTSSCVGTGTIVREVWSGIPGKEVSLIPVNSPPSSTSVLTLFEGPFRVADNYGARIRGYICVPSTGNYTLWIASDDRSELWLGTSDNPASKVRIAYVGGATSSRQWDKYTSQRSVPIHLTAGQRYYIEALHKESVTYDHVAVGWQLPNGTMERPIPGNRLMPFESAATSNFLASNSTASQSDSLTDDSRMGIHLFPNPAHSGVPELTISRYGEIQEVMDTKIEIVSMTGEIVYTDEILCEGNCDAGEMKINKELVSGIYLVNVVTNGRRFSKRLLVK